MPLQYRAHKQCVIVNKQAAINQKGRQSVCDLLVVAT